MEPKEKAEMIMKKMLHEVSGVPEPLIFMYHKGDYHVETARQCALFMADEMLFQYTTINADLINALYRTDKVIFWQSVKTEIEKL